MSEPGAIDPRLHPARNILAAAGLRGARVSAAGHQSEIAAVSVPAGELARLLTEDAGPVVEELKKLGFRYVAVDLAPAE